MPLTTKTTSMYLRGPKKVRNPAFIPDAPLAISASMDFTTVSADLADAIGYEFDFTQFTSDGTFDIPRMVFIDNSEGPNQLFVDVSQTPMDFPIPPYSVACLPTFAQPGSKITIYGLGGSTGLTDVYFLRDALVPFVYSGFAPVTPGFQVQAQPPAAKTITNRNFALVVNVAHDIFPAVQAARMIRFANLGDTPVFYNVGNTAIGTFANGDTQLDPNSAMVTLPYMTASRISFINPTDACNVQAQEISF